MNTHINPDKGAQMIAPGITCQEASVGANVTALAFAEGKAYAGLGDGRVVALHNGQLSTLATHQGAVTGLCVTAEGAICSAGQDGRVLQDGADLIRAKATWITEICQTADLARIAIAYGQSVDVIEDGKVIASLGDFPSTVSGLSFFADGTRLAISHYSGISLWSIDKLAKPERLDWAGSMISASVSPDGRYVAGATQDREVHIWDLATDRDFRLGGYRTKVKSMGWTKDTPYLYTSGADALVAWGLAGDPGAFPPQEIGFAFAEEVSAVCPVAQAALIPAGFTDGSLLIGEAAGGTAKIARIANGAPVTRLIPAGDAFCFGTKSGEVGVIQWQT